LDSLTHIVVGACIGETLAGRQLGKKALLIGAIANSLPDIDVVASFFLPLTSDLLAHRGFTHSLLFIALSAPILAFASQKLVRNSTLSFSRWLLFWSLQCFVHIFIDAFNAYGTGWFEPFSHYRVAFNTMFVADPLFTIWPSIATIALLLLRKNHHKRQLWARYALVLSSLYLITGIGNKLYIDSIAKKELALKHISTDQYFSTPTPLNNILWYVVTKQDSGFYIGYRSLFDKNTTTKFRYVYQNNDLLKTTDHKEDINRLIRFSKGFYTVEQNNDTLKFNDLRFGEILGWNDTVSHCVFFYYPQFPDANELIVQRGRFAGWDAQALRNFFRRIGGN
jgi:inner membrane protein